MKKRHKRLIFIGVAFTGIVLTATLVLKAFNSNLRFFITPTQVVNHEAPVNKTFRLGGLVKEGSLQRQPDDLTVHFVVTDTANNVTVSYTGILPDLFKEGQGVVAQGKMEHGLFKAEEVLAKHDEEYMPPEAAEAIKKAQQARKDNSNGQGGI
ncbi:MAG: cytochrome c maturation protein CcmE [Gammaproteobacteria bacterium]|nr:MAG: cytochrome c maturation protein CcmE [Gammaproteobacteria bacterium]